jgi:hypothetical protein
MTKQNPDPVLNIEGRPNDKMGSMLQSPNYDDKHPI